MNLEFMSLEFISYKEKVSRVYSFMSLIVHESLLIYEFNSL